jgi:DNA primase
MARIPDEVIEQVRDAADLLEIVQEQVQLKRTGSDWRGPCPFHGGTNRNFAVIPKDNYYYCFVCHESGDVFTWYRKRLGMDYPTAVREVARRVGILIPETAERAGPDPREPLFQACDAAQGWFAAQLRDGTEAETARRYLLQREFSLDVAATLGLGYAPRANDFVAAMKQLGIAEAVLIEAGLVVKRDDGTLAPRFRARLLFPIHDLRGRVVGFGGRILGAGEPKYLNSPETPIFRKGEQLYHMHLAKHAIRKAECAVLVEGYFDVQRLAFVGIEHVVAPLGTSLTEAQAVLLKRFAN